MGGGEGSREHFRLSDGSAPCPCFKSGFPIKHSWFIPGGALAAPFCAASPFHIALVVRGCADDLHGHETSFAGALGEGRGLLPGGMG